MRLSARLRSLDADRSFMDFVDKLEIRQLDVESLGHIEKIGMFTDIGEIETNFLTT